MILSQLYIFHFTAWFLTFGVFSQFASFLAAAEAVSVTRNGAVEMAFRNSRELVIAELEVARAKTTLRWSGKLDNPQLELNYSDDGVGLDDNEGSFEVAFSQRFPVTSRLKDEKRLRRYQVILAGAEIAERRRELAGEVDLAAVEVMAIRAVIARQRRLSDLNVQIVSFLKDQMARGQVSNLDVTQARLTGRSIDQGIRGLVAEEKKRQLKLKQLMGIAPDSPITVTSNLKLPNALPDNRLALDTVFGQRPDFILAVSRIDEAGASIALEKAQRWGDVAVKIFGQRERAVDEPTGLERNTFLGVGISIPLPLRQRNQEGIEKSLINRNAAEKSVDAVEFRIRSEYEEAFQQRLANWELASAASGEVLNLAQENFTDFQKAYQEGQASLLQVQRAQEQQLELETAAVETIADYFRADARFRFVTGDYPGLHSDLNPGK
ncbi:TolC family protein [Verrucomicrobiales bacterium BCK34]|nr:TolC family protein [Verrucomicrobiales bacterium BCK34]